MLSKLSFRPPSQPSLKGEGVNHFPLGGNRKGGKKLSRIN